MDKELIEKCLLTGDELRTAYKTWRGDDFVETWDWRLQKEVIVKTIPIIEAEIIKDDATRCAGYLKTQAEEIKKGLEDGQGEWHDVPEAGGECYCIYKHSWQAFFDKYLGEV